MINYQFSQKLKPLENNEINHLTNILILSPHVGLILPSMLTNFQYDQPSIDITDIKCLNFKFFIKIFLLFKNKKQNKT